jgi:hypothetical protein
VRIVKMGILTARQRYRVSAGVFLYLTPNGGYCWYRHLAPLSRALVAAVALNACAPISTTPIALAYPRTAL